MNIRSAFIQAGKNVRGNFSTTLAGIVTTCFSLVLLGVFTLLFYNMIEVTTSFFYANHYSIFLKKETSLIDKEELLSQLKKLPGTQEVVEVSAQQVWDDFLAGMGEQGETLESLPLEDLPELIEFRFTGNQEATKKMMRDMQSLPIVDDFVHGLETQGQVAAFFQIVFFVGIFLLAMLSISIVFIIGNSIKIAFYDRINEIEILKILGATPWFIKFPYLLEGIFISLMGFITSVVVVYFIYEFLLAGVTFDESTFKIKEIARFYTPEQLAIGLGVVIFLGIVGAHTSSRKILKKLEN